MLRFGTSATVRKSRSPARERLQLWLLFAGACVILFAIRMLQVPETAQRIDRLFLPPEQSGKSPDTISAVLGGETDEVEISAEVPAEPLVSDASQESQELSTETQFDLSAVRDNTYFRPEENSGWFAVWDWLATAGLPDIDSESLGEVSYVQFIDQPEVYRGRVVTVRGTVEREELLDAPANDMGIENYHRLILRPVGGEVWPIVVYTLELPPKFPRGDSANGEVDVHGVFFKNWSYSWQGGLGLAPVVLARTIEWHPAAVAKRPRVKVSASGLITVSAAAGVIASLVGWFAWRQARRSSDSLAVQRIVIAPPREGS